MQVSVEMIERRTNLLSWAFHLFKYMTTPSCTQLMLTTFFESRIESTVNMSAEGTDKCKQTVVKQVISQAAMKLRGFAMIILM